MQYTLTPYSQSIQPWCWWEKNFTDNELDWLQELATKSDKRAQAGGITEEQELLKVRRSHISWLHCNQETEWVFKKLAHVASSINSEFYRFDLTGFGEDLQLTNYNQSENGMYGWHCDYGIIGASRKLSMVVQLTDPSQYEGGNLQIMVSGRPQNVQKQRGLIAVFPSYQIHQVTPVTQGSRQSLVAWISGPPFK
jgi:PKHD-type hydroxylase